MLRDTPPLLKFSFRHLLKDIYIGTNPQIDNIFLYLHTVMISSLKRKIKNKKRRKKNLGLSKSAATKQYAILTYQLFLTVVIQFLSYSLRHEQAGQLTFPCLFPIYILFSLFTCSLQRQT